MFVLKLQSAEVILIPTAHYGAWDILGILHRDISSGNILIYPIIDKVGNTRHIIWQGVLADWEMAKNMREEARKRQPHRTVRSLSILDSRSAADLSVVLSGDMAELICGDTSGRNQDCRGIG